jgi:hypothetical protein
VPRPSLLLQLLCSRPAEVSIELGSAGIRGPLIAHELRSTETNSARLGGVELDYQPFEHRIRVRVRVPDDLPDGSYSGLFIDRSDNLPRGTLTVSVLPSPEP